VILCGDVGRFYFQDFEGNYVIGNPFNIKISTGDFGFYAEPFNRTDLSDAGKRKYIIRGTFNGGTVMHNVKLLRENNITTKNFLEFAETYSNNFIKKGVYFGDQGLMASVFLEKTKFHGFPQCIHIKKSDGALYTYQRFYCAYNFDAAHMLSGEFLSYDPVVLQFDYPNWKPLKPDLSEADLLDIIPGDWLDELPYMKIMKDFQAKFWEYAKKTPVYEKIKETALEHCRKREGSQVS
jgi:hypothetical protein